MNLWETLLHPDKEELENPERRVIADAANILQVGEFQLLQLAYRDWFCEDLPEDQADGLFQSYMVHGVVPLGRAITAAISCARSKRAGWITTSAAIIAMIAITP